MTDVKKAGYKIVAVAMVATLSLTVAGVLYTKADAKNDNVKETTTVQTKEEEQGILVSDTERLVGKEETVYVIAGADGSVEKVIVSNWLKNPDGKTQLEDESNLEDIVNVKGEEGYTINKDNMKVWEAGGQDIYYQGSSKETLPVEVAISYQLDGKTISAEELAGKSGKVSIRFDYTNNRKETVKVDGKDEEMYVPFVMVSGMILDNKNFTNVKVSNGKLINDGDRSIVVGFALPGLQENLELDKDKMELPDYVEITANVNKFELETTLTMATSEMFRGIDLDSVKTLDELEDSIHTLSESSGKLVDGSSKLYEGTSTLLDKSKDLVNGVDKLFVGAGQLKEGAKDLNAGAVVLKGGIATLDAGVAKLQDGANALNAGAGKVDAGADALAAGTKQFETGMAQLAAGAPALSEGIESLQNGLAYLTSQNDSLVGGATQVFDSLLASTTNQLTAAGLTLPTALTIENYEVVLGQVITALEGHPAQAGVQGALAQLQSYQTFYDGVKNYTGGVSRAYSGMVNGQMLAGAKQIANGAGTLANESKKLTKGSTELAAGTKELTNGTASLVTGIAELAGGSTKLAAGSKDLVAGTEKLASGSDELYNGIATLKKGSGALIDGVKQLDDGAMQLSDGMKQFDEQGIKKIADAYNGDIKGLINRLKGTVSAAEKYQTFSGKAEDVEGSVKFIFRTEGVTE